MSHYTRWNNLTGWFTFLIAAVVYLITLEPTVSFWDCGEFISCAYKQQIGHPPGAPLYMMLAKVFSLFASDPSKVAVCINALSAISSAFTILFLFWTITRLAVKIVAPDKVFDTPRAILILGAGLIGALAFTFSDTFWFSAVEAEVYATSSLFTAVVFWAILKWEDEAGNPYSNRWLMLIAYLMGLSIGIHLLNLLTIPALALVFYFKKYKPSVWGVSVTILISFAVLATLQYGIIAGLIKLAGSFELMFVNTFGFSYYSGIIVYVILIVSLVVFGLWLTFIKKKVVLNSIILAFALIILGYCSYAMVVIRSNANPPLNENQPDDVFSLLSYLNREQYGSSPLVYGAYYNAPVLKISDGEPTYTRKDGKYVVVDYGQKYVFDPRFMTVFPRMYGRDQDQVNVYKQWGNVKGKPVTVQRDNQQVVEYLPRFRENLTFFFTYQVGYMYIRYFMWNFVGRQNDIEGNGGVLNGNWITGFGFIDKQFLGPQDKAPAYMKENKGRNVYYLLPLLLGILGLVYHFGKNREGASVVLLLFLMTGLAVVVYLNQTPLQPRERDYAYAGSFYAFAIWIGLGVLYIADQLRKWLSPAKVPVVATLLALVAVPGLMAVQNWDDHDRSGRFIARDVAYNYLNSCAPNAILFTNGDNDTFPLWYLQEVEGVRTDVRVVNLTLLETDWYINQQKRKIYNANALPISLKPEMYLSRRNSYVYFIPQKDVMPLKEAISFVTSSDPATKVTVDGSVLSYFQAQNFTLPVDSIKVKSNGTVSGNRKVSGEIAFSIPGSTITRGELVLLDIMVNNNWERPLYFTSHHTLQSLGLEGYLLMDGYVYRMAPVQTKPSADPFIHGGIETSVLYNNLMNKYHWSQMSSPDVYIDNHIINTFSVLRTRLVFSRLAEELFFEGKKDSAKQVLRKGISLMPYHIYPHDLFSIKLIETAYKIDDSEMAHRLINEYSGQCFEETRFFYSMNLRLFTLTKYKNMVAQQTIEKLADIAGKNGDMELQAQLLKGLKESVR